MKKVVRAKHITILQIKVVDLLNEKVEDITFTLPHWYTSEKIMLTKLADELHIRKLKLIEVYNYDKYSRYYEQTLTHFEENAETVYDVLYRTDKKERNNENNEKNN